MTEAIVEFLRRQGVALPAERAESVVRAIAAQIEAERAATRALPFEAEPCAFLAELEKEPE